MGNTSSFMVDFPASHCSFQGSILPETSETLDVTPTQVHSHTWRFPVVTGILGGGWTQPTHSLKLTAKAPENRPKSPKGNELSSSSPIHFQGFQLVVSFSRRVKGNYWSSCGLGSWFQIIIYPFPIGNTSSIQIHVPASYVSLPEYRLHFHSQKVSQDP